MGAQKIKIDSGVKKSVKIIMNKLEVTVVEEHISPIGNSTNMGSHSFFVTKPNFTGFKKLPNKVLLELHFNNMEDTTKHGVVCYPVIKSNKAGKEGLLCVDKMKFSFTPRILAGDVDIDFNRGQENLSALFGMAHDYEKVLGDTKVSVKEFYDCVVIPTLIYRLDKIQLEDFVWTKSVIKKYILLSSVFGKKLKPTDKLSLLELAFKAQEILLNNPLEIERNGTEYIFKPMNNLFRRHVLRVELARALSGLAQKKVESLPIPLKSRVSDQAFTLRHFKDRIFTYKPVSIKKK